MALPCRVECLIGFPRPIAAEIDGNLLRAASKAERFLLEPSAATIIPS